MPVDVRLNVLGHQAPPLIAAILQGEARGLNGSHTQRRPQEACSNAGGRFGTPPPRGVVDKRVCAGPGSRLKFRGDFWSGALLVRLLHKSALSLARALAPSIRVNAVCPGYIASGWFTRHNSSAAEHERAENAIRNTPLKAASTPEDVADPIVFLAGPQSRHIIGETLLVDAGAHLGFSPLVARQFVSLQRWVAISGTAQLLLQASAGTGQRGLVRQIG